MCYYNGRERVAEVRTVRCIDEHQADFARVKVYDFNCGATNVHNLFSWVCESPCRAVAKGVALQAQHNRTVVYGPPLALGGAGGFLTFGLFDGTCEQLARRAAERLPSEVANKTDDDLIKFALIDPPGKK